MKCECWRRGAKITDNPKVSINRSHSRATANQHKKVNKQVQEIRNFKFKQEPKYKKARRSPTVQMTILCTANLIPMNTWLCDNKL